MTKRVSRDPGPARGASSRPRRNAVSNRTSNKVRVRSFLALCFLICEIGVALGLVAVLIMLQRFTSDLPDIDSITDIKAPTATSVWSNDGICLGTLDVENHQPITLDQMPQVIQDATIAIEDHRFYEHQGIDLQGMVRAAWVDIRGGAKRQGASTLTQQLARNVGSLGISRKKDMSRKAREILTAIRMEQFYSKKEILQLYLNYAYYGAGANGIQAASMTYFGKSASKLDLAEAALLAGLPQRPRSYTPFEHRKDALKRRDEVLDAMLKWGYISSDQCADARAEKPKLMPPPKRRDYNFKAPYFTRFVLHELVKKYGVDFVESGVRIDTTLDYRMQQFAEHALEAGIERNKRLGANQGALVSIDEATGYVRAMVGGRDFASSQYNIVTQGRRQPGSTFKLFDYAAAFDTDTFTLRDGFVDRAIPYPGDPKHRVVTNEYGETSGKWMNFKDAIRLSKNTIAIQVAQKVGMSTINEYAHKMGVTTELSPYLPTAIGATAVHPIDLCYAYTIIPNHGNRCLPICVVKITSPNGEQVDPASFLPQVQENILKPTTIQQLDEAFLAVCTSGTGVPARGNQQTGIVENAHGKTGTTDEFRDVWFAGYTPELTTVVWVGSVAKDSAGHPLYRSMHGATGGHTCGQIWHDFMVAAIPLQREFQAANPDLADPNLQNPAAAAVPRKVKRAITKPPATAGTETTPPDEGAMPDPENPDNAPTSGGEPESSPPPSQPTRPVDAAPQPQTQVALPPAPKPLEEELVTVKLCDDSGDLVNGAWCPSYSVRKIPRSKALRMHKCRTHHAPPGETE